MAHESVVTVVNIPLKENKVHKQLMANERSNFSDQGNNTYIDNKGVTRDAIGREIEVGSGYDLHSNITPADKSNNNIQADPTINGVAQGVVMNDSLLEFDNEIQNFTDSGAVIPFSDAIVAIGENTLTDTYKPGNKSLARQLEGRTYGVDSDKNLITPGYETKLIDEFGDTHGRSEQNIASQYDLQKVTTDNEFFGSTTKYVSDAAAESIQILANNQKISDEKSAEALALLGLEKTNNANIEVDIPYSDGKLQSLVDEAANGVPYVPYKQDPEGGTSENNLTGQTVYNPRKLELEREREDAAKAAQAKIDLEISNRLAFQDSMMKEQDKVLNGIAEGGAGKVGVASPNILSEERLQKNLQRQEEGFQDVINNTTAADVQETITEKTSLATTLNKRQIDTSLTTAAAIVKENIAPENYGFDTNSVIGGDPYAFSTLQYPSNVFSDSDKGNGHYMLFYVNVQNKTKYEYSGYGSRNQIVSVGDTYIIDKDKTEKATTPGNISTFTKLKDIVVNKGAREHFQLDDINYSKRSLAKGRRGSQLYHNQTTLMKGRKPQTGINSLYPTTTRITDSVALYLPPNVTDSTSATYRGFETGMAGMLAMGGIDLVKSVQEHDFAGAARIFGDNISTIATEAFKKFSVAAVETFTRSEGVQETFDKAFGQTLNPYLEVAFTSMGMRKFEYTFKFAPEKESETQEVRDIIQLFRFHMVPELKGKNERYLTLPSTFDIHYMYQDGNGAAVENTFYNKIATCVLNNVTVDYTPDGIVRSFESGAPTQINLTLSFDETEMLTKQKVNDGY